MPLPVSLPVPLKAKIDALPSNTLPKSNGPKEKSSARSGTSMAGTVREPSTDGRIHSGNESTKEL